LAKERALDEDCDNARFTLGVLAWSIDVCEAKHNCFAMA